MTRLLPRPALPAVWTGRRPDGRVAADVPGYRRFMPALMPSRNGSIVFFEREVEVVALLARGLQTKQVARVLGISVKTADRHIQNAYAKIGVSTRAAAALFAMQNGLTAWGELPIAGASAQAYLPAR